jgi:tetratricopeptide (TPR) repeat protein
LALEINPNYVAGENSRSILNMEEDVIDRAMASGDPAAAEEAFHEIDIRLRSLTSARERADLLMRKAVVYEKVGRIEDARKQLRAALKEAPDDADVRLQFDYIDGSIYHQDKNFGEAFARLSAVLSNYSGRLADLDFRFVYEDIQQQRAFELFALGDYTNAIPLFEEVLSFESLGRDRSVALANLGNCYARLKNFELARRYLEQAISLGQLHSWEGQAHYDLALTYACLNLLEQSKRELELCAVRAAEYHLPLEKIYNWLSRVCKGLGERSESEHYARLARPC